MKTFNEFLAIGAVALGVVNPTMANEQDLSREQIRQQVSATVQESIKKQFDMGFLTEKAHVNVKIMSEAEMIQAIDNLRSSDAKNDLGIGQAQLSNSQARINNECNVNLVYNENGNLHNLTHEKSILKATKFQNATQHEIANKFAALHEHHHCEFTNMNEPVRAFGKDAQFNKNLNFLLKDQMGMPSQASYMSVLNENYADTGAALSLIKEYGANNPDLDYVLKALKTQRHSTYFSNPQESHITHFSLDQIFSPEVRNKLDTIKDAQEFQNLALDISNKGVQQIFAEQPQFANRVLSGQYIFDSTELVVRKEIYKKSMPENELKTIPVDNNAISVEHGLTHEIADKALSFYPNIDSLKESDPTPNKVINGYDLSTAKHKVLTNFENNLGSENFGKLKNTINEADMQLKEFKETFPKVEKSLEVTPEVSRSKFLGKVGQLRKEFIESTNKNKNSLKFWE